MEDAERVICTVLRHEPSAWIGNTDPATISHFLAAGGYHGVLPLLGAELRKKEFETWPAEISLACREATIVQAKYELAHRAEMIRVLDALSAAGVTALILKGTALAYNLYPNPTLRPRGDTDLLIPDDRRRETDVTLARLGYAKSQDGEGELTFYEASWERSDRVGAVHCLDVHWRINNSHVLGRLLGHAELAARAVPLPALGPHARALAPVDALLFACIHRAGHAHAPYYSDGVAHMPMNRLIWLYDIHLLVSSMSAAELDEFVALAAAKQMKEICRDALLRTCERFGTAVPPHLLEALHNTGRVEPSARFLTAGRMRLMFDNVCALEHWSDRLAWARELAFPPARYMRVKYAGTALDWLPLLYLRRALGGMARLIWPSRRGGNS